MAIDPVTGSLILRGAMTGLQALSARDEGPRPTKTVPTSVRQATERKRRLAQSTTRPGRDYANRMIRGSTATALNRLERSTTNPGEILQGVGGVQAQENRAMAQQSAMDEQYQAQAERDLARQENLQGQYEEANFQYNQARPYEERRYKKNALIGSALSNLDVLGQDVASYDILGGFDKNNPQGKKGPAFTQAFQEIMKRDAGRFPTNSGGNSYRGQLRGRTKINPLAKIPPR